MATSEPAACVPRQIVIRPNASLSPYWAGVFLASMCVVSFGIGGLFAAHGYWMVLPFAGLEMAALAAGLWVSLRHNGYREVVSVYDDRVVLEKGLGEPESCAEFPRAWTQVRLEDGPSRNSATRLMVSSGGRGCELGRCLTDGEKREVAGRLRQLLRAAPMAR